MRQAPLVNNINSVSSPAITTAIARALRAAGLTALPVGLEDAKALASRAAGMPARKKGTVDADRKDAVLVLARLAHPPLFGTADSANEQLLIWARFCRNF